MLDRFNPLVKSFRMAKEMLKRQECNNLNIQLIHKRYSDGKRYNLPTCFEVPVLIIADIGCDNTKRDIIVHCRSGLLQRISELHSQYLAMLYPLLFQCGEDGYREDICLNEDNL